MKRSFQFYFFSTIATVLFASVVVMGIIQTYFATNSFKTEKQNTLQQLVSSVSQGVIRGEIDPYTDSGSTLHYMAKIASCAVFVTDKDGIVLFSTDSSIAVGTIVPENFIAPLSEKGHLQSMGTLNKTLAQANYIEAAPLQNAGGEKIGFVFAIADASGLGTYLADPLTSFFLSSSLALLVAGIFAVFLTNRMVVPIRRITEAAHKFGEGNYAARVEMKGDGELAQLALTFNEMANSIEATDRSRRSFMGNIAHELRTPMTTIKGFIDGMLDGTIPQSQREKYLMIVSEEVGRLARLTKNMLDISRLEAGESVPNTTVFNIWSPVSSVFLSAEQRIEEKSITVKGLGKHPALYTLADEDNVHQILFNIIDNAIKFTAEKGEMAVNARVVKGMVTVSIRNTGVGIPEESLPYIFDRFYKADKSRGMNVSGSGLGLHICKVLTGLMGGRIWAESKVGEWTEFFFTLPVAPNKKIPPKTAEVKPGNNDLEMP